MANSIRVVVTQADIDNARKQSYKTAPSQTCPIAQSLKRRKFPGFQGVGLDTVCVSGSEPDYKLPEKAQRFITDFDRNYRVEPIQFTMKRKA